MYRIFGPKSDPIRCIQLQSLFVRGGRAAPTYNSNRMSFLSEWHVVPTYNSKSEHTEDSFLASACKAIVTSTRY